MIREYETSDIKIELFDRFKLNYYYYYVFFLSACQQANKLLIMGLLVEIACLW